jgi:hypothetical protein
MKARHSTYDIRNTLEKEISAALNESYISLNIEISELNTDETYSIKGIFKVIPFLWTTIKRKGTFEAKLDEDLKIINLKITEETN